MIPKSAPKYPGLRDRCHPLEYTAAYIPLLRSRFGITRVGDTSLLDRTAIPTYCAIVPKSPDILGVYNGKGRSPLAARVSAVMEAFERQAAAHAAPRTRRLPVTQIEPHFSLERLDLLPEARSLAVECVEGTDLLSTDVVPVPLALVRFPWRGERLFARATTNGLASGNNIAEAIYHALTEMVERHIWSLYYVRCELVPQFYGGSSAGDQTIAPVLAFPTGDPTLDGLFDAICGAGLRVRVTMLQEGALPVTALAAVLEPGSSPPMAHIGMGCSLSPAHAVERALTEAVQSRVVDVQAAREDILRPGTKQKGISEHAMRLTSMPEDSWFIDLPAPSASLHEYSDESSEDVATDARTILDKLRICGIRNVVAVDISPDDQPFAAVRIVGPDFETTALDGRIGSIALAEFTPLKSRLIS